MSTRHKLILTTILMSLLVWSCGGKKETQQVEYDGFDRLVGFIEKHTDFIHSEQAPGVIEIDELINGTKASLHIIDMRPASAYDTGHFPGAVNVRMNQLLNHLEEKIDPSAFDTIALISEDAQEAFYALALLRLLGYDNLYAVRFGMGWHIDYAPLTWEKALSSKWEHVLVTGDSPTDNTYPWPEIKTTESDEYLILHNRVSQLLQEGYTGVGISAEEVLSSPESFFIINYWPEHEYRIGHIPGARQYTPKKSLQRSSRLNTLPTDQLIVIYCHQGNNSATAAAHLRVLGYQALSLNKGSNSFMYEKHSKELTRGLFNPKASIDFPLEGASSGEAQKTRVPILEEVKGEGGC
jgi:rhodanese-related sulfurtransferase